jgi:hypothetical protein
MTESAFAVRFRDKADVSLEAGAMQPLGSTTVTVRSRELERVVLFRGQIRLGDRQAGRVNRNDAVLFRNGWDACPGCDDENGYDSNA